MPKPQYKDDVLRLVGMAILLGKFVPNISKVTDPLRQVINRGYNNRTAKKLPELKPEQDVCIFNHTNQEWEPREIVMRHPVPRSYYVSNSTGNVVRRNRFDLKKSLKFLI